MMAQGRKFGENVLSVLCSPETIVSEGEFRFYDEELAAVEPSYS